MKIAIIHNHPIHYKHLLFQEMKRAGLDFAVIFLASQSDVRHEKISLARDLYDYRIGYEGPYESAGKMTRAKFTWATLSEIRPDAVIISSYNEIECWAAWLWCHLYRKPKIIWLASNEFDSERVAWKEGLKKIFVRGCEGANAYGKSSAQYLIALGMNPSRIGIKGVVPNNDLFATAREEKNYFSGNLRQLTYVGRLAPEKNVGFLLQAFARAVRQEGDSALRLNLVGTGPLENTLREQARQLGIEKIVQFVGYCPQKELPSVLRKSDFFILPSCREPWGLVAAEGMLCRLPVLISRQCGCEKDLVTPETGWSFSATDEAELSGLLASLCHISKERVEEMGAAAFDLAKIHNAAHCAQVILNSVKGLHGENSQDSKAAFAKYK